MKIKRISQIILIVLCLILTAELVRAYVQGEINSTDSLRTYIKGYGFFAPAILTFFQALQVIIPVLPGALGNTVGGIMFGWLGGFICNYIGITTGSIIAFLIAKKYGTKAIEGLFPKKKIEKYTRWAARSKSYTFFLVMGMLLPLFPDDFFCYFSGLTQMSRKKFIIILLLSKPWCILAYSLLAEHI